MMGIFKETVQRHRIKRLVTAYLLPVTDDTAEAAQQKIQKRAGHVNQKTLIRRVLDEKKVLVKEELKSFNPNVTPEILLQEDRNARWEIRKFGAGISAAFVSGFLLPTSLLKMAAGGLVVWLCQKLHAVKKEYTNLILPDRARKKLSRIVNDTTEEVIKCLSMPKIFFDYLDVEKLKKSISNSDAPDSQTENPNPADGTGSTEHNENSETGAAPSGQSS